MTTGELKLRTREQIVHGDCGCGCGCDCCTEAVGQREAVAVELVNEGPVTITLDSEELERPRRG